MLKRLIYIVGILAAAFAAACNKTEPEKDASAFLTSVQVQENEHPLRIPISLTFSQACSYQIEYWKKDDPTVAGTTRVFQSAEDGTGLVTVMFVYPETVYEYHVKIIAGEKSYYSDKAEFTTGSLPAGIPEYTVATNYPSQEIPGYIFQWQATAPGWVVFCDTDGKIVWYEKLEMAARQVTFDPATRTISMLLGFKTSSNDRYFQRWCKKVVVMDLEGNRSVDFLTAPENIDFPHHEIKRMPDGNIAVLCGTPKVFDLSSIGGEANTTVYGDGIKIMSPDFKTVLWEWDCFQELDPIKDEYLDAVTRQTDLIHANSIAWDSEGNLYFTSNYLNEMWKIDRATGKVLYRVGDYGDIALPENGHASGLHSAEPLAPNKVLLLDNGSDKGVSRAIIYEVDPVAKTAKVPLSVSIPGDLSSRDRSNALLIRDGSMLFFGSTMGYCNVFTDLDGNVLKVVKRSKISYRSYYFDTIEY